MEEADKQDYEAMEEVDRLCQDPAVDQDFAVEGEFDGMCHEMALGLQKIHDKLPTDKEMRNPASRHDSQYSPSSRSFNHLLSAMASVQQKLAVCKLH